MQLAKKWFILAQNLSSHSTTEEIMAGTQGMNEPGGRTAAEAIEGKQLTGLLPMSCSPCFPRSSRTTCSGMTPSTVILSFPQ